MTTDPTTTEPVPTTAPWSVTTVSAPKSWRPSATSLSAVTVPLRVAVPPDVRTTVVDGVDSVPRAAEENTSRKSYPGADLDLSVYRGTTLVDRSADGDSEEAVSLANPVAGTYTVLTLGDRRALH